MPKELEWPPKKDDLQRLYVDLHLSAMKIAKIYKLDYANPKTSESTILYHLKKNGIARRDPTEHVRMVTEEMVDEWAKRYRAGESLKQIAGGELSPVTVWSHLKAHGIELRDKVDAQIIAVTKHQKSTFRGDASEKAYLEGLAVGDFDCTTHGRAVRVRLSTTHPAMMELFRSQFADYGFIHAYPRHSELSGFEWSLECDLDRSFSFLLKPKGFNAREYSSPSRFLSFLAGFFDAEGSIFYHKKRWSGGFEVSISNLNFELLEWMKGRLTSMGFHPAVQRSKQKLNRGVRNGGSEIWRLRLWRLEEAKRFLKVIPIRHREKVAKADLVMLARGWDNPVHKQELIGRWNDFMKSVRVETLECVRSAEEKLSDNLSWSKRA